MGFTMWLAWHHAHTIIFTLWVCYEFPHDDTRNTAGIFCGTDMKAPAAKSISIVCTGLDENPAPSDAGGT